jgi:Flp pilus assembly protein TadG
MHDLLQLIGRFRRDERGIFAVFFGLVAVVLVATAGAVVDFTTLQQARTRAQDALDSAALGLQPTIWDDGVTEATIGSRAQSLLDERLANANVSAEVTGVTINKNDGLLRLGASITVPMVFVQLVGVNQVSASVVAEARRGSVDLEVSVALDVTGSMGQTITGSSPPKTRIQALKEAMAELIPLVVKDVQTPTYTKMALVPYSMGVNVGAYAASVRGSIEPGRSITGASWASGTAKTISGASWASGSGISISGASRANPARITTSSNHGLSTGDTVWITGVNGMTQLNNKSYVITVTSTTQFTLNGVNSSSYSTYSSGGTVTKCQAPACAVVVTTSTSHDFATNDNVRITGVNGMTQINTIGTLTVWPITVVSTSRFVLVGTVGPSYSAYTSGGSATKCRVVGCEIVITTSAAHGIADGEKVHIVGVNGMTQTSPSPSSLYPARAINSSNTNVWTANYVSTTQYSLDTSYGPSYASYTSGGSSYCTRAGCEYYAFRNAASSAWRSHQISTCVSERIGANKLTDAAPSIAPVGRNYPAPSNGCLTNQIVPLTSNKADLNTAVNALQAGGSTAGHIGIAWSWYLISPNFGYLFPSGSQPAAYGPPHELMKVAILMTDGEYNSSYCNGVISQDSTSGSGSASDHINCNAHNGSSWSQAEAYCTAMKAAGVIIYTVGFQIVNNQAAIDMMANCATDAAHAHVAESGQDLRDVFVKIGQDISKLRLSE